MDVTGEAWINPSWRTHVMAMSPDAEAHLKNPIWNAIQGAGGNT